MGQFKPMVKMFTDEPSVILKLKKGGGVKAAGQAEGFKSMAHNTGKTFEGAAISIELPARVTLEIVETEPVVKGQTASSSFKTAVLSNGTKTMVPPHIGVGTRVVVMTEDGSYVDRAKD